MEGIGVFNSSKVDLIINNHMPLNTKNLTNISNPMYHAQGTPRNRGTKTIKLFTSASILLAKRSITPTSYLPSLFFKPAPMVIIRGDPLQQSFCFFRFSYESDPHCSAYDIFSYYSSP